MVSLCYESIRRTHHDSNGFGVSTNSYPVLIPATAYFVSGSLVFGHMIPEIQVQEIPENASQLQAETGIEGALDVQTMLGIAWPIPLTTYSTGGLDPDYIPDL
jgi:hypothetical protein